VSQPAGNESFLLLFFKKEALSYVLAVGLAVQSERGDLGMPRLRLASIGFLLVMLTPWLALGQASVSQGGVAGGL
jgi:hypothetical protein